MITSARLTDFITSLQSGTSGEETQAAQLDAVSAPVMRRAREHKKTQSSRLHPAQLFVHFLLLAAPSLAGCVDTNAPECVSGRTGCPPVGWKPPSSPHVH